MLDLDTYRTIAKSAEEVIFKDKGSKFLGYGYPLQKEAQVREFVEQLKKQHHKARHWCYAWQIGVDPIRFRANDDGEPTNSAGQPIYGQILSKDVTDVLIVVVRYYGGTKLGVGGLVNAYKTTAQLVLEASHVVTKTINKRFKLVFEYPHMDKVMRILKEKKAHIEDQKMELLCEFEISIRKKEAKNLEFALEELRHVKVSVL